jgi:hypothetical protein
LICKYANKLDLQSVYFPLSLNYVFPSLYVIFKILIGNMIYNVLWIINYFFPLLFNELTSGTLYTNWFTHEFEIYFDKYREVYGIFTENSKNNSNIKDANLSEVLTNLNPFFIINMTLGLFLPTNYSIYPNGFYKICAYFLKDINILYDQEITSIIRKDNITIISNNEEYKFDYLFIGCLPHLIHDKIKDFDETEKRLLSPIFHNSFYSILINAKYQKLKPFTEFKNNGDLKIGGITQMDSDVYLLSSNCEDVDYLKDMSFR